VVLSAQTNGVTVSDLVVDAGTVTFNVGWNKADVPAAWSDTVWVFVDYNHNGAMKRAPLSAGATLTAHTAPGVGKVVEISGNNKGVWVVGNARSAGSFSATVKLFTATTFTSGACAYGSNYPPVGEYTTAKHLVFTGTPMYDIVIKHTNGSTKVIRSDSDFYVPTSYTVQSFSDQTGAPGIIKCMPAATYTLYASASAFCLGDTGVIFALSGTEAGNKYRLYRDNMAVGTMLAGSGSAATFSGAFNTVGTYTAQGEAGDVYCAGQMSGSHTISEYPLPVITTQPQSQLFCNYNVQLTLTVAADAGGGTIAKYQWKRGAENVGGNSNTYTATISTSGVYTVEVTNSLGCRVTSAAATVRLADAEVGAIGMKAPAAGCSPGAIGMKAPSAGCSPGAIGK
jgi:hypothetical protein